jgi:ComF family protein
MSISLAAFSGQLPKKWAAGGLLGACLGQDCALCGSRTEGDLVCARCEQGLPRPSGQFAARHAAFDSACAAFEYRFPVDRMVVRFKHGGDLALGAWLARRLALRCAGLPRPEVLVAPPLSARRLRSRGFDQGAQLARAVGRELGIRHGPDLLERLRDTPPQQGLTARARRANLRGAFRCRRRLEGRHVAIVDDVFTTGATAGEIARVLRAAGAGRIDVWAVARTPGPEA